MGWNEVEWNGQVEYPPHAHTKTGILITLTLWSMVNLIESQCLMCLEI